MTRCRESSLFDFLDFPYNLIFYIYAKNSSELCECPLKVFSRKRHIEMRKGLNFSSSCFPPRIFAKLLLDSRSTFEQHLKNSISISSQIYLENFACSLKSQINNFERFLYIRIMMLGGKRRNSQNSRRLCLEFKDLHLNWDIRK